MAYARLARRALVLALLASLVGCKGADGPSAAAVDDYLARQGVAPSGAVVEGEGEGGVEGGGLAVALPAAAPTATRIALTVDRGWDIPDTDPGPGDTDAYVIVEYEGHRHETSIVSGSLEPVWGDSFVFDLRPGGVLTLTLMDDDTFGDERLGVVSEPLPIIAIGERRVLEFAFRSGEMGRVQITVTGLPRP